jgi:uncharacterized protein YdeI (YjbR/CyaY-like superfamily)
MPPVIPDPNRIRSFPDEAAFEAWLADHHDREPELWLRVFKKAAGVPTVTYAQAVDVALCWGWIDGQSKSLDATSFLQRFTPRRPRSLWSERNREHIDRLTAAGRMTPHGQAQVDAAKADGRWESAYAPASTLVVPDDLLAAIEANPDAKAVFDALDRTNRYAFVVRVITLKTPAGRARRIADTVERLARGELPYPKRGG